jgi:DNA-binding NarL/FixJ family response regulator
MRHKLHTRSFRNHRDDHGPRLVATGTTDAIGASEKELAYKAVRSRPYLVGGADDEAGKVVPLFRVGASNNGHSEAAIRVLLAEGQALVRAGYRALLESDELIEVVGEAASQEEALARAWETRPDVAVLDLGLLGLADSEEITRFISHPALADVAVMLIAPRKCEDYVLEAVLAGAVGVLAKDAEPTELIRAVQVVARGQALLPVHLVRQLFSELRAGNGQQALPPGQLDELTGREREVVALVARGLSNQEIAARLVISPATAKTHVSRAMLKLDASHRAQLVVLAYEAGLVHARPLPEEWLVPTQLVAAR